MTKRSTGPRTTLRVAVGLTAALTGSLGAALTGSPAGASSTPVPVAQAGPPASCFIHLDGVVDSGSDTGQITRRTYDTDGGIPSSRLDRFNPGRLAFVPRGFITDPGGSGGRPYVNSFYVGNSPAGGFYRISAVGQNSTEDVVVAATVVDATWASIRSIIHTGTGTTDSTYLYGLTDGGGFYRYELGSKSLAPYGRVTVGTSGWQGVRTMVWERVVTLPGTTRRADVFLATTTDGKLVEYTVPLDHPEQWTRVDLKSATWGGFKVLTTGDCSTASGAPAGRMLLGVLTNGDVYTYWDKNATDGSGADIVGYGKAAAGWTEKLY